MYYVFTTYIKGKYMTNVAQRIGGRNWEYAIRCPYTTHKMIQY